ncbi:hypothetical protein AVEN_165461-1 [Araneus ventricosus]|uniref:Uncharacterized protein n=1 Tax=Araneus ventricosus TaxID=182803 RepID=A0A4Y2HWR2_ARAVE|nr:hypothetical protein AVEN_165461-1 [Araneus ventricosus]
MFSACRSNLFPSLKERLAPRMDGTTQESVLFSLEPIQTTVPGEFWVFIWAWIIVLSEDPSLWRDEYSDAFPLLLPVSITPDDKKNAALTNA